MTAYNSHAASKSLNDHTRSVRPLSIAGVTADRTVNPTEVVKGEVDREHGFQMVPTSC